MISDESFRFPAGLPFKNFQPGSDSATGWNRDRMLVCTKLFKVIRLRKSVVPVRQTCVDDVWITYNRLRRMVNGFKVDTVGSLDSRCVHVNHCISSDVNRRLHRAPKTCKNFHMHHNAGHLHRKHSKLFDKSFRLAETQYFSCQQEYFHRMTSMSRGDYRDFDEFRVNHMIPM